MTGIVGSELGTLELGDCDRLVTIRTQNAESTSTMGRGGRPRIGPCCTQGSVVHPETGRSPPVERGAAISNYGHPRFAGSLRRDRKARGPDVVSLACLRLMDRIREFDRAGQGRAGFYLRPRKGVLRDKVVQAGSFNKERRGKKSRSARRGPIVCTGALSIPPAAAREHNEYAQSYDPRPMVVVERLIGAGTAIDDGCPRSGVRMKCPTNAVHKHV